MTEYSRSGIGVSDILITDFIKALLLDAAAEDDPERRAQLEVDAHRAEDIWQRSKYALAPTRDAMTAALGNASLNLAGRLDELLNISKDTHLQMQDLHGQVPQIAQTLDEVAARQGKLEALQAALATEVSNSGERLSQLTIMIDEHTDRIAALMELGKAWERWFRDLTTRVDAHDMRLADHAARLLLLEQYAAGVPEAERQRIVGVVEENERRYIDIQAQLSDVLARLPAEHVGDG
jgi:hypothetical protein